MLFANVYCVCICVSVYVYVYMRVFGVLCACPKGTQ